MKSSPFRSAVAICAGVALSALPAAALLRVLEVALLAAMSDDPLAALSAACARGWVADAIYLGRAMLALLPLVWLAGRFSRRAAGAVARSAVALALALAWGLAVYYAIAGFPADRVVFAYSWADALDIAASSRRAPLWSYAAVVAVPAAFVWISGKISPRRPLVAYGLPAALAAAALLPPPLPRESPRDANTADNKLAIFARSLFAAPSPAPFADSLPADSVLRFQSHFPALRFAGPEYPFLHEEATPDVLSPLFVLENEPPSFVFVIVEGLGSEFSGAGSRLPSATPFLDSLASRGLAWRHCLSTSQRTIAALPSIFGALPMGRTGFMNYRDNAPDYTSLLKTLRRNGYRTSFFYGGWLCFDDMCTFLRQNEVEHYLDIARHDTTSSRNSWGLHDGYMMREAVRTVDIGARPRAEVYLTLTTHDPFDYPDADRYTARYERICAEAGQSVPPGKARKVASYLYFDDCLRRLVADYGARGGLRNTIFVVTGDHSFDLGGSPLQAHSVPLVMWSPMARGGRSFGSLATHRDIAPSLAAMLACRFGAEVPGQAVWLGRGLDTLSRFSSRAFAPLMDVGREVAGMVYNDLFIYGSSVYMLCEEGGFLTARPPGALLDLYRRLDIYAMENNRLSAVAGTAGLVEREVARVEGEAQERDFMAARAAAPEPVRVKRRAATDAGSEFPLALLRHTWEEGDEELRLEARFDFLLPGADDSASSVKVVTEVRRGGEVVSWSAEELNGNWFDGYGRWSPFATRALLRRSAYGFRAGDQVLVYLWNASRRECYLSRLGLTVSKYVKTEE